MDIYIGTVAICLASCFVNLNAFCGFDDWGMVLLTSSGYMGKGDHRGSLPQTGISVLEKFVCEQM